MPVLIHIGKTGGSALRKILNEQYANVTEYHHRKNYKVNEKYIIWIRNPISRFVSAYNYSRHLVTYNCNNKKPTDIDMSNCLCPPHIRRKIINKTPYVFSNEYDNLIKFFKSANDLAESLSSNNSNIKQKAIRLMNNNFEHIHRGIGWYLNKGNFVRNRNKNILFVGKQETMEEDVEALGKILNKPLKTVYEVRKNIYSSEESKYLSPLAINNIITYYKDKDYAALIALKNHGWITEEVLASYYLYTS